MNKKEPSNGWLVYFQMVPVRGIEPRVDPYHGPVLPLYYTGSETIIALFPHLCQQILTRHK